MLEYTPGFWTLHRGWRCDSGTHAKEKTVNIILQNFSHNLSQRVAMRVIQRLAIHTTALQELLWIMVVHLAVVMDHFIYCKCKVSALGKCLVKLNNYWLILKSLLQFLTSHSSKHSCMVPVCNDCEGMCLPQLSKNQSPQVQSSVGQPSTTRVMQT